MWICYTVVVKLRSKKNKMTKGELLLLIVGTITICTFCYIGMKNSDERIENYIKMLDAKIEAERIIR